MVGWAEVEYGGSGRSGRSGRWKVECGEGGMREWWGRLEARLRQRRIHLVHGEKPLPALLRHVRGQRWGNGSLDRSVNTEIREC